MSEQKNNARTIEGKVVSNKMKDTIVVMVERRVKHPKYEKAIRRRSKIAAHDQGNTANIGDEVTIAECRPISKTKAWRLVEIRQKSAEQVK